MNKIFSQENYNEMIQALFCRFPSFQKVGAGAYKPGIANMEFADQLMGHPHRKYRIIHVAGTNGKGSVSNMLTSVLASYGLKVGLYTSPHILDFRERIRIVESSLVGCASVSDCQVVEAHGESAVAGVCQSFRLIPERDVWDFVQQWNDTFDHLDMSFFEITTLMALDWFAKQEADVVVLETGLGGRLDSTNIVNPVLSVITNIGLDHCDMLGDTLAEIAFEKAGIIKPKVPVVVGESHPEIDTVFERKVLYTNLSEPEFMGSRTAIMSLLTFADKVEPTLWERHEDILSKMDLRGDYQRKNLRTVLAALDVLKNVLPEIWTSAVMLSNLDFSAPDAAKGALKGCNDDCLNSVIEEAIINTAARTGFAGRWQKISDSPMTICDIGHNEHGLKYNFAQLASMKASGRCTDLIIVYGSVADKDVDSVIHLMPTDATYIFTQANSKRALTASAILGKFVKYCADSVVPCRSVTSETDPIDYLVNTVACHELVDDCCSVNAVAIPDVVDAVAAARELAAKLIAINPSAIPLIYIGGSTYVVSEAVAALA